MKTNLMLVSLILAAVLFTACGSNNTNESNNDTTNHNDELPPPPPSLPQDEGDNGEPATSAADYAPARYIPTYGILHQPVDLDGRIIRVINLVDVSMPPFPGHGEEPDPATSQNYRADRLQWDNAQRVMHSFNFEMEEVNFPPTTLVMNRIGIFETSIAAGAPIADVAYKIGFYTLDLIINDMLIPLDSINLPNSDVLGAQIFADTKSELFGKRWSFGQVAPPPFSMLMGVNLDLIAEIGAPNPINLLHSGQWNWDNFLEIMRLGAGSAPNRYGIAFMSPFLLYNLIAANDGSILTDELTWNMHHPNSLEALEFARQIFSEGLLYETGPFSFRDGNTPFFLANVPFMNEGADFTSAVIHFPAGPSNTSGNVAMGIGDIGFVFPQGLAWDPAEILMVFEEFWAWPHGEAELMLEAASGWTRDSALSQDDIQRVLYATRNTSFCVSVMVPDFSNVLFNFAEYFRTGEMTPIQAVDAYRDSQQAILDEFFGR